MMMMKPKEFTIKKSHEKSTLSDLSLMTGNNQFDNLCLFTLTEILSPHDHNP